MKAFVLTNNPMVQAEIASKTEVVFKRADIKGILEEAALYVAEGCKLLTHPLSGSVKPGETPYKSMLIERGASSDIDVTSAQLISNAIAACDKFEDRSQLYDDRILRDYQMVDLSLIGGALGSRCA